jgi:hypothetical protein
LAGQTNLHRAALVRLILIVFGYLGAAAALSVAGAIGLMVLVGESASLGKSLASYPDAKGAVAAPKLTAAVTTPPSSSMTQQTTGLAVKGERPTVRHVHAKVSKTPAAAADKRKKRTAQAAGH